MTRGTLVRHGIRDAPVDQLARGIVSARQSPGGRLSIFHIGSAPRFIARFADEWNLTNADTEIYEHKLDVFLQHCKDVGRDPSTVKRSIMQGYIIGATESEVLERAERIKEVVPRFEGMDARQVIEERSKMWFVGTPDQIAEQIYKFDKAGVDLLLLQCSPQLEEMERFAEQVIAGYGIKKVAEASLAAA